MKKLVLSTFLFFVGINIAVADIALRARFLSANNGLGTNYARVILQDSIGYIWIGSTDGLVRYDGNSADILTLNETAKRKLMPDYRIQDMKLWKERFLLIRVRGRKYGCYDICADKFVDFSGDYEKVFSKQKIDVSRLSAGIPGDAEVTLDNRGNTIAMSRKGDIWHIDAKSRQVTHITGVYSEELLRLNGSPRFGVVTDKDGLIWISTYGNGLFVYDCKEGKKTHYLKTTGNIVPIQTNYLTYIYEDREGNIWVCQENMGVAVISKQTSSTETMFFDSPENMGHANSIHLLKNVNGIMYIGNRYNGLKLADGNLQNLHVASRYDDDVVVVCQGKDGTLWMGTRNSGVYNGNRQYRHDKNVSASLSDGKISDILCDKKGRIWISIFNGGVDMAEPDGKGGYSFRHFFTGDDAIETPRQMVTDHHGYIWLSSDNGFYVFNPDHLIENPKAYKHLHVDENVIQLDAVHCFMEDSKHRILVGTQGSGLAIMDNSKVGEPQLKNVYTTKDGLPNNNIQQLIEDRDGYIWIGTDHGLSRYDTNKKTFISFLTSDFLQGNMFVENAACRLADGRLAFGSRYGIAIIDPHNLPTSKRVFKPRITDIDINGVSIYQQEDGVLASRLMLMQELTFNYKQNSLTFYFSDFNYNEERNTKYSYRLTGYDDEWSPLSTTPFVTYKNLPPGDYTFELKVQGANGEVSELAVSLPIVIQPPFWATWWAYILYLVIVIVFGYYLWRNFQLSNRIKVEKQLTEFKMQFFTNISHEFRTPLTIIRGATERMKDSDKIPADMKQPVSSIRKSANRLMRLINQLMEFSKMHEGKLRLSVEETEVVGFLRDIYSIFRDMAENKNIDYQFTTNVKSYLMYVDRDKLDKIAYNIISNAFKYTPSQGSVKVSLHFDEGHCVIAVADTGIGIAKDKQQELFARFNQSTFAKDSIGIGLHLSNELARLHHGSITYSENPGGGSIFTVTLPTDKSIYSPEEFMTEGNNLLSNESSVNQTYDYKEVSGVPMNDLRVLIVDDDYDVREYLCNELQHFFQCDGACDGDEALIKIQENRPDLIISDVIMPGMNGYELTKKLRSDQTTSDIPIILLTALSSEEKHAKGLSSGADAYIAKPFSMQLLIARCTQLLEQRNQLKLNYAKEVISKPETPAIIVEEQDRKLRAQLDNWISQHLKDSNLNIDLFAEKMGYGRTTFYKKVKKLTGKTPNDYIKTLRMERAVELLKDDTLTVAQVSYDIGIEDPYYFSKTFKAFYGISPTQYRKGEKPSQE